MLLSLDNVTKMYAQRLIFMGASVKVEEGDRIGLVGANGAGKSTLLNVLEGSLAFEEGERAAKAGLTLGFLKQDSGVDSNRSILEEMREVFRPLLDAQAKSKQVSDLMQGYTDHSDPEYQKLADTFAQLQTYFETNEGYQIDIKIQTVLNGMGFGSKDLSTPCGTLSGGEKTRLALAKLLLGDPELLMLDEPTNHLDFATLQWLEEYLQGYRGAIVVVSHDRYFLDKICNKIWEVANLRVTAYKGNYTKYQKTREMVYERQLKEYRMQQQNIAKLTDFIARNKVRASTAALAHSREKELERLEIIKQPPKPLHPVHMAFRYEQEPVKDILHVKGLCLYAGGDPAGRALCKDIDFDLMRGEKVALVGPNGVGKSTFLKSILRGLKPEHTPRSGEGRILWGRNVKVSYFEQGELGLHGYKTVLEELWDRYPQTYEQDLRNILGSLHFSGEAIQKRVDMLSGGEKARLKFAIMMYEAGNVLILDEPTNHLDISTKEVLDHALMEYQGTILAVSHDRYLLNRMPTRMVEMLPDGLYSYPGNYEQYLEQKQKHLASEQREEIRQKEEKAAEKEQNEYYRSKKQRAQQAARKHRLQELEQEISDVELSISRAQESFSDPEISSDYQKTAQVCAELEEMRARLNILMEEWAELAE